MATRVGVVRFLRPGDLVKVTSRFLDPHYGRWGVVVSVQQRQHPTGWGPVTLWTLLVNDRLVTTAHLSDLMLVQDGDPPVVPCTT